MIHESIATNVGPDHIDIAYERRGDPHNPPVLLIMGIAAQLVHWPPGLLDALVSRELQVLRFDNRDAGRSTHMRDAPPADLPAALAGDLASVTYTLSNMAGDAAGLLDALGIDSAHVVGASLGGAIAQTMALEHPTRVRSLTTMMSTTGAAGVGQVHPETMKSVFGGPPATTRAEVIARRLRGSDMPPYQDTYGWIAYQRGNYDDAVKELEKAVQGLGEDPQVRFHLAMTYLKLGREAEALKQFNEALARVEETDSRPFVAAARQEKASLEANGVEVGN